MLDGGTVVPGWSMLASRLFDTVASEAGGAG
jgi:hypothetical protein